MQKYTVKEVSEISGVTIKALYHYQKIGLLQPYEIAENGYRYYTETELKGLQEIITYRNLNFSLAQIKNMLDGNQTRLSILLDQEKLIKRELLKHRKLKKNIKKLIKAEKEGTLVDHQTLFIGTKIQEQYYSLITNYDDISFPGLIILTFGAIAMQLRTLTIFSSQSINYTAFFKWPSIIAFSCATCIVLFVTLLKLLKKYYGKHDVTYSKNNKLEKMPLERYCKTVFYFDNSFNGDIEETILFSEISDTSFNFYQPFFFKMIFPKNAVISLSYKEIDKITISHTNNKSDIFYDNGKRLVYEHNIEATRDLIYPIIVINILMKDNKEYKLFTSYLGVEEKIQQICREYNLRG